MSKVGAVLVCLLATPGIGAGACAPSSTASPAPASVAGPTTPSSLRAMRQEIIEVVNRNRPRIKACYQSALLEHASLQGGIEVEVDILSSGAVRHVDIQGSESLLVMEPCLRATLSTFVFPSAREPYGTGFSYVFRRSDVLP